MHSFARHEQCGLDGYVLPGEQLLMYTAQLDAPAPAVALQLSSDGRAALIRDSMGACEVEVGEEAVASLFDELEGVELFSMAQGCYDPADEAAEGYGSGVVVRHDGEDLYFGSDGGAGPSGLVRGIEIIAEFAGDIAETCDAE